MGFVDFPEKQRLEKNQKICRPFVKGAAKYSKNPKNPRKTATIR
jgi:hypothetical protein